MVLDRKKRQAIYRVFLCLLGSFVLAFGTAVFLTPAEVVAGGVSGIGIIINYYVEPLIGFQIVDIIVWSLNIILFIVSFIFLGKRFTFHTLIATFAFPAFLTLIMRTGMFEFISNSFGVSNPDNNRIILAGIFGGLFVGLGVALTFIGDGSTGGLDVLFFVVKKYLRIKVSITSFALDGIIILVSTFAIPKHVIPGFIGILSALISAIVIEFMYVRANNACIIDIVTTQYKEINSWIIKTLDRTATVVDAQGAYTNQKYKLVHFVVDKHSLPDLKNQITLIDPKAFVTITSASQVLGEGFLPLQIKSHMKKQEKLISTKKKK